MEYTIEQQEKGTELLKTLAQKAWESSTFKEELIKNPVAIIEQVTGKNLTNHDGKKIVVEDQTDESVIYLNIPAKVNLDELELTEEQLEQVAGGTVLLTAAYVGGAAVGFGLAWLASKIH